MEVAIEKALVTGASSGIGRATAMYVNDRCHLCY
jgi:NADP-dependent 3-hydroxy acid dehydrogenase YdfG